MNVTTEDRIEVGLVRDNYYVAVLWNNTCNVITGGGLTADLAVQDLISKHPEHRGTRVISV